MMPLTATLEAGPGAGVDPAAGREPQPRACGKMKFAYKTGARPLDGYEIQCGVGVGGFGDVYFAKTDAGKEVALKRIQRNLEIEVRGVKQCLNLKHPNLVALYDIKSDDEGQTWVVMEYVGGESLKAVIDRNPNGMPVEQAERWFRGIAAGVGCLHDHGIVHRDLKPANIFDDQGFIKVGDYGLSKFISTSRRSGQTESVGTVHYMAPEIGRGVYGKEIDVYALGIILYEMLTGRVPFDGESSQEIIMKHLTDNPDLSAVPLAYREVIQRALRKDPLKRFRNVAEMLDALQIVWQPATARGAAPGSAAGVLPEIVFGPVRHRPVRDREVVAAQLVSPGCGASPVPRASGAAAACVRGGQPASKPWSGNMTGSTKALLIVAIVLVLHFNPLLIPLGAVLGIGYLCYLGVRKLTGGGSRRETLAQLEQPRSPAAGSAAQLAAARAKLKGKPAGEHLSELTGSMLSAAFISAVLTLVILLLQDSTLDGSNTGWAIYAWLASVSTIGAWILLTLAKFWEADAGEHLGRRFVMLAAGLAIGAVACGLGHALLLDVPDQDHWTAHAFGHASWLPAMHRSDGSPLFGAYLLYFAGLFAVLRWWRQMDPLRKSRLSIWTTAVCLLWAWVMHSLCSFPQPWGFILAATMSVAVQLAAPWVSPAERVALVHQPREV